MSERLLEVPMSERRVGWIEAARGGPLAAYLDVAPFTNVGHDTSHLADGSQATVLAAFRLQDAADYRATLREWFRGVRVGGHLVLVVPHAFLHERQLALPSRFSAAQRRLYTPRSLLDEVEEALPPNSYRVRHLSDFDQGYDYSVDNDSVPIGHSEIVLVLEKRPLPSWKLLTVVEETPVTPRADHPDYAFAPTRTRVEVETRPKPRKVLILKLDHMGDLIMSIGALERARAVFADAEITLVVGSWNADMARGLNLVDQVIPFDVFPRNSSEEEVNVAGKAALFQTVITHEYDLAIDLRTDHDTRFLLRLVKAGLRAGIGTRSQFPFLDIFLPLDFNRNEPETAREYVFNHHAFSSQGSAKRSPHRIMYVGGEAERDCAMIWGPYRHLRTGRYVFEPYFDVEAGSLGLNLLDIGLDTKRVTALVIDKGGTPRMPFVVEKEGARFEFRIWTIEDEPSLSLSFFGGRLVREGAASVLHQSEYMLLLIELVAMRLARTGVLDDLGVGA